MKTRRAVLGDMARLGLLAALPSRLSAAEMGEADLILWNGKIITVDAQGTIAQAVAIKDGQILKVGSNLDIGPLAGPQCQMIDLQGRTVTPGLVDSHHHLMYYGRQFWPGYLDIRFPRAASKADLLQLVGEYAAGLNPGDWVSGNQGFHLQPGETLDRWDLDRAAPKNPVYLCHGSGQYAVVNSPALQIAGIDAGTPNPQGSLILRNADGEPTGVLSHYPAEDLVARHAAGYGDRTDEQKIADIERGVQRCLQAGYTSVQDVIMSSPQDIQLYMNFADSGRLSVRLSVMLYVGAEEQLDSASTQGLEQSDDSQVMFNGWKLAVDGGIAAGTVLMYDKSLSASRLSYPYHSQETLNRIVRRLHDTGFQIAVHAVGDQGIDMALTAFEDAVGANPRPDPRHRIEHGLFPSTQALQRMKEAGIVLSTQPQWIAWHGDALAPATNEEAMTRLLPLRTMLQTGIPVAFGCDVPASIDQEPGWAFQGACARRTPGGTVLTGGERLTVQEALRVHTMGSAYAGFAEGATGSLEPGKHADLVVWSHDLYALQPEEMGSLRAEMTIVNGRIVYDAAAVQ